MITEALVSLRPGAKWSMNGEDYDQLVWADTEQTKPTKAEVMAEVERLKPIIENSRYQDQRYYEYPNLREFADAYYWAQKGDDTLMNAYIAKCDAVKQKYPKPE